jgi:hypothetical protein
MKEFGYPFTLFIYTQWVNTGGKAISWAQLEEMRDAGVDIEAHTVSHHDLRHAPRGFPVVRSAKAEEARTVAPISVRNVCFIHYYFI